MSIKDTIINTSLDLLPPIENRDVGDHILIPFKYGSLVGHILFTAEMTGEGISWVLSEYECNLTVRLYK
jgi:hypothetical protein